MLVVSGLGDSLVGSGAARVVMFWPGDGREAGGIGDASKTQRAMPQRFGTRSEPSLGTVGR